MEQLRSDRPELRSDLVASQLVGVGMARYVLGLEPLASAKAEEVGEDGELAALFGLGQVGHQHQHAPPVVRAVAAARDQQLLRWP